MLDPTTGTSKWQNNLTNSTTAIKAGVSAVTTSPTQLAAAAADKWQAKLTSPDAKSKFVTSLGKVQLSDWQNATINVGIPRIAAGAQKGATKYSNFAGQFYPFLSNLQASISKMPSTTLEDNIARMTAQVRGAATFKMK